MKEKDLIPPLLLERYMLGELDPETKKRIEELKKTDEDLQNRLAALEESNNDILTMYPPEALARRIENKYALRQKPTVIQFLARFRFPILGVAGMAAALAFLLVFTPVLTEVRNQVVIAEEAATRAKGDAQKAGPSLTLYRQSISEESGRGEILVDQAKAKAGDLIQVRYFSSQTEYGTIFSIDGRGNVTLHYPATPGASPVIERNKEVFLRESFKLDNAPLFERFFFITSASPFSVSLVLDKAAALAKTPEEASRALLPLSTDFTQTTTLLVKE